MEELILSILKTTFQSFDFSFCIAVNILTYAMIKIFDIRLKGDVWKKRLILITACILIGGYYYVSGSELKLILNSSILAPVFWSWICKPILKKFKLDYGDQLQKNG